MPRVLTKADLLSTLPAELLIIIAHYLEYSSNLALRWTCKSLYSIVGYYGPCTIRDLLEIERWPYFSMGQQAGDTTQPIAQLDYFACHICLKIRLARYFSNAMMKGRRGKLSPMLSPERARRFCIPCGVRLKRYLPGLRVQFGGMFGGDGIVCYECHRYKAMVSWIEYKERTCTTTPDSGRDAASRHFLTPNSDY